AGSADAGNRRRACAGLAGLSNALFADLYADGIRMVRGPVSQLIEPACVLSQLSQRCALDADCRTFVLFCFTAVPNGGQGLASTGERADRCRSCVVFRGGERVGLRNLRVSSALQHPGWTVLLGLRDRGPGAPALGSRRATVPG